MIRKSYLGYPAWVDSPHAMRAHDHLQWVKQQTQDLRNHERMVSREWALARKHPAFADAPTWSDTVGTGSAPARKRSGGFLRGLVKFVFWVFVIGAILHNVPIG